MLELRDVSVVFGGLRAVDKLTMSVGSKELIGLIGPNGAGKTTVFNAITGVYPPTEGEVILDGERLNGVETHEICRKGIGRTFQNVRLFKNLTVLDNVKIALDRNCKYSLVDAFLRTPRCRRIEREIEEKSYELLDYHGLKDCAKSIAKNLPYGLQKHLEIARAMATNPKILLLDEPAAGLNDRETSELMEKIFRILEEHELGILLIEHDMKLVMGICQRIVMIDYGKKIAEGAPEEIRSNPRCIEAYLGKEANA
ncbi:MAG: ABC transporter ATP-binding protein [bacterium]|jgi:branched-chain amino acid transport system ATP-binding protein